MLQGILLYSAGYILVAAVADRGGPKFFSYTNVYMGFIRDQSNTYILSSNFTGIWHNL